MLKLLIAASALVASGAASAAVTFGDGGFETQGAASAISNGFCYTTGCASGAWSFSGNSGLQSEGNGAWPGAPTADGSYYGFVQDVGSFSQTFDSDSAGVYSLSWLSAGRPAGCCQGNQSYEVRLTSEGVTTVLFTDTTTTSQPFTARSIASVALGVGTHTITFAGLNPLGGDNTAFIDAVAFAPAGGGAVPEPATWALLMLGFGLVGAAARRRRGIAVAV